MRTSGVAVLVLCVVGLWGGAGCRMKPTAVPDAAVTYRGAAVDIPVLANDTDPRQRELTLVSATASAKGQTRVNPDMTVRYIPNRDAIGEDVFRYTIENTRGRSSRAEVRVTILESPRTGEAPRVETRTNPPVTPPSTIFDPPGDRTQPATNPNPANPNPSNPPTPPVVNPDANAKLNGVSLTIFTREDDKNAGETVQATIRRGEDIVAQRSIGGEEAWARHTDRTEEIEIVPPLSAGDAAQLSLEIRKVTGLGAGESWVMQVDVQGRLSDGRTVSLVPRSLPFRYGGGSSNSRTWKFQALPAVR